MSSQATLIPILNPDDEQRLAVLLQRHEGIRLKPYTDSTGHLTIGIGRNLSVLGISQSEALIMLKDDIDRTLEDLSRFFPTWSQLTAARKIALADMAFNIGIEGVLSFTHMVNAIKQGNWELAAQAMRDSLWAKEVGSRAQDVAYIMETGII